MPVYAWPHRTVQMESSDVVIIMPSSVGHAMVGVTLFAVVVVENVVMVCIAVVEDVVMPTYRAL